MILDGPKVEVLMRMFVNKKGRDKPEWLSACNPPTLMNAKLFIKQGIAGPT